jgi:hypothetical protein
MDVVREEESAGGVIEIIKRMESVRVWCHHIFARWAMYQVKPNRDVS